MVHLEEMFQLISRSLPDDEEGITCMTQTKSPNSLNAKKKQTTKILNFCRISKLEACLSDFYTIFFSFCFIIIWLSFLFQTEACVSSLKTSRMLPRQVNIFGRFLDKRIPSSQTC